LFSGLISAISSTTEFRVIFYWALVAFLACFIIGLFTRIMHILIVLASWMLAILINEGHGFTPLLLGLTVTIIAPWGDYLSIDRLITPNAERNSKPTWLYGYPIWLLGLCIGLTYTAAGFSKLLLTNGAWIWETGARNGFIQDFNNAVTDWGMLVTNNYWLSLSASILSAVGQTLYVWACFTRSALVKYGIAVFIALPFLAGLVLFMGLFWWPWAVLVLILYLPWPSIDRLMSRMDFDSVAVILPRSMMHRQWFISSSAALIGVHFYAVIAMTEYEPVFSNYPMYADRMLAGSAHEVEFWERYKRHDRNSRFNIRLITNSEGDGETRVYDLTLRYSLASFLQRYSIWRMGASDLQPQAILDAAVNSKPLDNELCSRLQVYTKGLKADSVTLLIARRYFDLVGGIMSWQPIDSLVSIDLTHPDCTYVRLQEQE
jgi:hypothetical protein